MGEQEKIHNQDYVMGWEMWSCRITMPPTQVNRALLYSQLINNSFQISYNRTAR